MPRPRQREGQDAAGWVVRGHPFRGQSEVAVSPRESLESCSDRAARTPHQSHCLRKACTYLEETTAFFVIQKG